MTISQMRRSVPRSWPKPRPETWGVSKAYAEYESKKPKDRPEAKPHRFVRRREEK